MANGHGDSISTSLTVVILGDDGFVYDNRFSAGKRALDSCTFLLFIHKLDKSSARLKCEYQEEKYLHEIVIINHLPFNNKFYFLQ